MLDFVGLAVVEGAFDLEGEVFAVVGVDVAEIGFVAAIELGEGDAEEAGDAVGPGDFAGGDIPGPGAHAGGVEREFELCLGIAMGGLGLLAFGDSGGDDEGGDGGDGDEHLEKPDIVHVGAGGERAFLLGGGEGGDGGDEEVGVGGARRTKAKGGPDEEGERGEDEGGIGVGVFPAADEYEVGDDAKAGEHGGGLGKAWGGPAVGARSGGGEEDGEADEGAEEVADGPGFEGGRVGGPGGEAGKGEAGDADQGADDGGDEGGEGDEAENFGEADQQRLVRAAAGEKPEGDQRFEGVTDADGQGDGQ